MLKLGYRYYDVLKAAHDGNGCRNAMSAAVRRSRTVIGAPQSGQVRPGAAAGGEWSMNDAT